MNIIVFAALICVGIGYSVGTLNPAYILSRLKGFDIRTKGTGNAGASNAMMILGKGIGVFCALFDIFKSYLTVRITARMFPAMKIAGILSGIASIFGHMFPVTMNFKGGKGLACLGGLILAYNPLLFVCLLSLEIIIVLVTSYVCSVATSASVIFGLILLCNNGVVSGLLFVPVIAAIWAKHRINFRRIRYGVEMRFRYLWKKQEEEERIRANWNRLSEEERLYVGLTELDGADS